MTTTPRVADRPDHVPPVMMNPALLPPGQAWEQTCTMDFIATDAQGEVILRHPCGLRTQGGTAGLAAHQQLVHGVPLPPAARR